MNGSSVPCGGVAARLRLVILPPPDLLRCGHWFAPVGGICNVILSGNNVAQPADAYSGGRAARLPAEARGNYRSSVRNFGFGDRM